MSKFKVGDRVVLNQDYCPSNKKGWEGVVTRVEEEKAGTFYGSLITALSNDQKTCTCFERRLDLVDEVKSDQKLADDLRTFRDSYLTAFNTLLDRGFHIQIEGSNNPMKRVATAEKPLIIKKTVSTEVVL